MAEATRIKAHYDKDTFRCHRYLIEEAQGIKGSLYIDKEAEIPKEIIIELKVRYDGKNRFDGSVTYGAKKE